MIAPGSLPDGRRAQPPPNAIALRTVPDDVRSSTFTSSPTRFAGRRMASRQAPDGDRRIANVLSDRTSTVVDVPAAEAVAPVSSADAVQAPGPRTHHSAPRRSVGPAWRAAGGEATRDPSRRPGTSGIRTVRVPAARPAAVVRSVATSSVGDRRSERGMATETRDPVPGVQTVVAVARRANGPAVLNRACDADGARRRPDAARTAEVDTAVAVWGR